MERSARAVIQVCSPYDGSVVGEVPAATVDDVAAAIGVAHAQLASPMPAHERAGVLERAASLLAERREQFAQTIMREAGKPILAARGEVDRAVDTLRFCAVEARSLAGMTIPMDASVSGAGKIAFMQLYPRGVVGAITPFNFPLNLCCHKIGPAIAAGCPVVHKPASQTALTAVALRELMLDAGLPAERYQLVCGEGHDVGEAITGDDRVEMITFTGSSAVGWKIRERAAKKHVSLELGNCAPLIVFSDADLDDVAAQVATHGYSFAGQSCISIQRVLVERSVYAETVERIAAKVSALGVGDPALESTHVGPVIDATSADRVWQWLEDAVANGARAVLPLSRDGNVIHPALLADVQPGMQVACAELFGPGVVMMPFDSEDEAITIANGTPYGLQAGVMTRDLSRAMRIASQLAFGGVTINEAPTFRADQMPYGGIKDSGNTREGPHYVVRDMSEQRLIVMQQ